MYASHSAISTIAHKTGLRTISSPPTIHSIDPETSLRTCFVSGSSAAALSFQKPNQIPCKPIYAVAQVPNIILQIGEATVVRLERGLRPAAKIGESGDGANDAGQDTHRWPYQPLVVNRLWCDGHSRTSPSAASRPSAQDWDELIDIRGNILGV